MYPLRHPHWFVGCHFEVFNFAIMGVSILMFLDSEGSIFGRNGQGGSGGSGWGNLTGVLRTQTALIFRSSDTDALSKPVTSYAET